MTVFIDEISRATGQVIDFDDVHVDTDGFLGSSTNPLSGHMAAQIEEMEKDDELHAKFTKKLEWINYMLANPQARVELREQIKATEKTKGVDGIPELF